MMKMSRATTLLTALPLLVTLALPASADARLSVLMDVLKMPEAVAILRAEGLDYAQDLNTDMLAGQGGPAWQAQIDAIYDPGRMVETVRARIGQAVTGPALEDTIAFFDSGLGTRIIELENTARAAMSDPDVEDAARANYAELTGSDDARLAQVAELIEAGDMLNRNVTSAMNANYQFMRGLADGDAVEMTEEDILADVATQQDQIAEDTEGWLYGFMLLAYSPLSDEEFETYIAFSRTAAGRALNRGLFDGFGAAYVEISYALGQAVAVNMVQEEL
jgi:hypothetical protein